MTDPSLVRVMQAQTKRKVGLINYATLDKGAEAVRQAIAKLRADGVGVAIVDALADAHLDVIAESTADLALVTAGSGVGLGIANEHRRAGRLTHAATSAALPRVAGLSAVVSGSCSEMTNAQVAHWTASRPAFKLDPLALAKGPAVVEDAIAWARDRIAGGPVLIYATATPDDVKAAQKVLGVERAGAVVEEALAHVAKALVAAGVRKLIVAGGETSGAVVSALGVTGLRIGPQIDPGVPWTVTLGGEPVALALKSGNFGTADFFTKALAQLEAQR
jgi:uncharacterized protein YgbK (DUF1537 family)